ncbi:DUF4153 domain-containing protein [Notoacmeibacter ruber]|uniref:DUF4153 domain-containing protein n=1 Tax=Notoacmeibacter ruber TaxID=2670375 RepID=A0A3L7JEK5_9HYPH|nr:DUF4153 domain-containing protein [Notoacmeibacter ruber]RLQ88001.1 DUF4153 domain-containing protein [Notoacmeibacter ruber]
MAGWPQRKLRSITNLRGLAAEGVKRAFARFSVTITALFGLSLSASLAQADVLDENTFERFGAFFLVAALSSLVIRLASEAHSYRWIRLIEVVVAVVLGLIAAFQLDDDYALPSIVGALVLLVPAAASNAKRDDLPVVLGGLGFAAALGLLTLAIFAGGLSGTLASLRYLFGLPVPDRVFAQTWIWTGLFVAPLFALGRIPERGEINLGGRILLDRAALALFDFGAFPLLIIYTLVLHAYAAKIAISASLPRGQIGWMVLGYLLTLFGTLIITSGHERTGRPATSRFMMRYWPALIIVPVGLLFVSLYERVGIYGVTEERYLLGLGGLVVLVWAVMQVSKWLRNDYRLLLCLGGGALLLSCVGPWSARSISIESQLARFEREIADFRDGEAEAELQAMGALAYLNQAGVLDRTVDEPLKTVDDRNNLTAYARHFGLDPDRTPSNLSSGMHDLDRQVIDLTGYDVMIRNVFLSDQEQRSAFQVAVDDNAPAITARLQNNTIVMTVGAESATFDLQAETRSLAPGEPLPRSLELSSGARKVRFLVQRWVWPEPEADKDEQLGRLDGSLLFRRQDWIAFRR